MAGSIALSMTQQLDQFGAPLAGAHLYFIQAGTVATPQNAFQDSALTLPWPNPIILSASGRIPQLFFADGSIKIRLTDVNGVEILVADGILVLGASSGGGGGSPVDATTVLATGDIKVRFGAGVLSGFVRCNGRTVGSATSGATERANADTAALFDILWNSGANITVSGGRGGSSAADFAANKTCTTPDWRGRALAGMPDMGAADAGRLTTANFGSDPTVLGAAGGAETSTLLAANLPPYTPAGSVSVASTTSDIVRAPGGLSSAVGGGAVTSLVAAGANTGQVTSTGTLTGTAAPGQISTPVKIAQPTLLATIYLKL